MWRSTETDCPEKLWIPHPIQDQAGRGFEQFGLVENSLAMAGGLEQDGH